MKRITVYACSAGFDLYQEARNYMTEMTDDVRHPTLKKTQRIWAIWKSGQNCIRGRSLLPRQSVAAPMRTCRPISTLFLFYAERQAEKL